MFAELIVIQTKKENFFILLNYDNMSACDHHCTVKLTELATAMSKAQKGVV